MRFIKVKFKNYSKEYYFKTDLNLISGGVYYIVADNKTKYDTPVFIVDNNVPKSVIQYIGNIRTITSARLICAPPKPDGFFDKIWINKEKRTVVIKWKDGVKTKVKCQDGDSFDAEKGIALCYMKRFFENRGCYNDVLKKYAETTE